MDQKPIVLDLRMKAMALDAIHDDLVRTLGKDPVAYSTVTKILPSRPRAHPSGARRPRCRPERNLPLHHAIGAPKKITSEVTRRIDQFTAANREMP
jgi:hypothetical protein